jgi:hypothetical protein
MVVMWCKRCRALMGTREPFNNWSTEYGVCANCLDKVQAEAASPAEPAGEPKEPEPPRVPG